MMKSCVASSGTSIWRKRGCAITNNGFYGTVAFTVCPAKSFQNFFEANQNEPLWLPFNIPIRACWNIARTSFRETYRL